MHQRDGWMDVARCHADQTNSISYCPCLPILSFSFLPPPPPLLIFRFVACDECTMARYKKILPTVSCLTDIYQCDSVWISLRHHHYHDCICKKWYCNFHDHVDIIPPSDSSSRWTKNVWQAEKCSIRSRKEKKRHNPISKQSTVTRFNFEIKTHFFCTDFASN